MVKFNLLLVSASATDFKFVSQTRVSLVTLCGNRIVSYSLTKDDVITSILYYLACIHALNCNPIKSEDIIFSSSKFKMHDLVPYLYSLINLYIHVRDCKSFEYIRSLPELKLTRSCHLPFEDEIIVNALPVKELCVSKVNDCFGGTYYVTVINGVPVCSENPRHLGTVVELKFPELFKRYKVFFKRV